MRMRKKPNLAPRMERCSDVFVPEPEELRGDWLKTIPGYEALDLEIGCGKGSFTAGVARDNPRVLLVAVERVADVIVVAMERAVSEALQNIRFLRRDADCLRDVFAPGEVRRIYLNFSDPWPKRRDAKRRLTSERYLEIYRDILAPGGELYLKTDNVGLFDYSLKSFEQNGWEMLFVTRDLHENGVAEQMTDYEERFHAEGVRINKAVVRVR